MAAITRKWIANAYRTSPADPGRAKDAVVRLYAAAGLKAPRVVVVPSPIVMAFAYGASAAIWHTRTGRIDAATRAATSAAPEAAIDAAIYAATFAATEAATSAAIDAAIDAATEAATRAATDAATRAAPEAAIDAAPVGADQRRGSGLPAARRRHAGR